MTSAVSNWHLNNGPVTDARPPGSIRKRQLHEARTHRDRALEILAWLTDERLESLAARCEMSSLPDGFPRGSSEAGPVSGGESSSTTEAAALVLVQESMPRMRSTGQDAYRPLPPDRVLKAFQAALSNLATAYERVLAVRAAMDYVAAMRDAEVSDRGQVCEGFGSMYAKCDRLAVKGKFCPPCARMGNCLACEREVPGTEKDRLRNGFCNACRVAWDRYAENNPHPNRVEFVRLRTKR